MTTDHCLEVHISADSLTLTLTHLNPRLWRDTVTRTTPHHTCVLVMPTTKFRRWA